MHQIRLVREEKTLIGANRLRFLGPRCLLGTGFMIAGFFGIFTIKLNPLTMLGTIISAIYVMYVLQVQLGAHN